MFAPMLAAPLLKPHQSHDDNTIYEAMKLLRYPVLASLKKDGIRALMYNGSLVSRTLKPIPNRSLRERAKKELLEGDDMELWTDKLDYNDIQSIVMSEEHPDSEMIKFHLLDNFRCPGKYQFRVAHRNANLFAHDFPIVIHQCNTPADLLMKEHHYIEQFGEGICFRTPDSPYKHGRSTLREQYLVKLCRSITSECTIIGFGEAMLNANSEKRNALGMMKRSSFGSSMIPKDTLGFLRVRDNRGMEFSVGTGFTDKSRSEIWREQDKYLGKEIMIRSKAHGIKVKPRCPTFVGFREKGY